MDLKLKREDIFFFLMDIYIGTYVLSESQLIYISQIDTLLRILRYVLLLAVCFYVVYLRVKNTATRLVVSFVIACYKCISNGWRYFTTFPFPFRCCVKRETIVKNSETCYFRESLCTFVCSSAGFSRSS